MAVDERKDVLSKARIGTRAVWAAESPEDGPTVSPINQAVTFGFTDMAEWFDVGSGRKSGHVYGRNTHPTLEQLEEKMRQLENAEAATSFSTGMAAISNALFSLLKPGDRVVSIRDTYGGTSKIFLDFLPRYGIEVELCETHDPDAIEAAIAKGAKVLYLETPTNPTLKVLDLRRLAKAGKSTGTTVIVDNTFATPVNQHPLELGADLVVHSATKFLNGHSDALGGILCGRADLIQAAFHFREINGATLSPFAAYLILRGLKTLELRVKRHNENAMALARFLAEHPKVDAVYYPGLKSDPGHAVAKSQMSGFGGVLSFSLKGGWMAVERFLPKLRLAHLAASLGSVGTLVGPPKTTSHVELSPEERADLGIPESLVRYSTGVENASDLVADLEQALEQA